MQVHRELSGKGTIFIISAPSGTGKTTICKEIIRQIPDIKFSVSYTTRAKRKGEVNGVDYFFISNNDFEKKIKANFFIEWADVYGEKYGTSADFINKTISSGKDVLLEIDVQGAKNIKSIFEHAIAIFILPPSIQELEKRMKQRNENSESDMALRLRQARDEIMQSTFYDYIVINDDLNSAIEKIKSIIVAERHKQVRMKDIILSKFIKNEKRG
jgi:guanylate kinase